jgi:branched-subunit amino acid aminotransferase/4-amino-4-deoxychorismate lyase
MLNFIFSSDGEQLVAHDIPIGENRSFLFGDGFFETIRLNRNGRMPLAEYHAGRISGTAELLGFSEFIDFSTSDLQNLVKSMEFQGNGTDFRIKLVFFRQGPGNYEPGQACRQLIYATCNGLEIPFLSFIRHVAVSDSVILHPSPLSGIKSTAALPYVVAGMERSKKSADEIILLSPGGYVVEGSFTSICWEDQDGIFFTSRELGGIDSCQRRFLEDYFRSVEMPFGEKFIIPEDLLDNSRWICFASALGLRFLSRPGFGENIPDYFLDILSKVNN